MVSPRNSGEDAPCPFCAKPSYLVYFTGPKTEAERKADQLEAERTKDQQRLMREVCVAAYYGQILYLRTSIGTCFGWHLPGQRLVPRHCDRNDSRAFMLLVTRA